MEGGNLPTPEDVCENVTAGPEKVQCLADNEDQGNNIRICNDEGDKCWNTSVDIGITDSFLLFQASSESNLTICDGFDGPRPRGFCYGIVAAPSGDEGLCGTLEEVPARYECFRLIALDLWDEEICGGIGEADYESVCRMNIP